MAIVYAVVNQKGGVGKTTTAVNIAAYIALAGKRVLLIDLDSQGNATSGLGVERNRLRGSTYDVLVDGRPIEECTVPTSVEGLALCPANIDLAGADIELIPRPSREHCLKEAVASVLTLYDIILVDSPPSLGLLTLNALVAADEVIIPIQTEYYALEGISQLLKTIELVKKRLNPDLQIGRVVLTMYDSRIRLAQQVVADVRAYFGDKVSKTIVPRNVRLSEAPSHGAPISVYDSKSKGAVAYRAIAQEVMRIGKERTG